MILRSLPFRILFFSAFDPLATALYFGGLKEFI